VTTASFSQFEDKERVQQVIDGFENLARESSAVLSPAERSEAEVCANYLLEQKELRQLCLLQPMQEKLENVQAELKLAKEKSGPWILIQLLLGLIALAIVPISIAGFVNNLNDKGATGCWGVLWPLCLFFLGGPLVVFVMKRTGGAELAKSAELEKQWTALLAEWPALNPEFSIIQSLQQRFQARTVDEVLKVQAEREAVITKVLKTQEARP